MRKLYLLPLIAFFWCSCVSNDNPPKGPSEVAVISPTFLEAGNTITIEGENLGAAESFVLNDQALSTSSKSSTKILLPIPEEASSGLLTIGFSNETSNKDQFLKIKDSNWTKSEAIPFTQLQMVSGTIGYATMVDQSLSQVTLQKTEDRGESWDPVLQGTVADFYFEAINENIIWAKGNNNIFRISTDGGQSWEEQTLLDQTFLVKDLWFMDVESGFLLASKNGKSYIYKTTDGGNTWENKIEVDTDVSHLEWALETRDVVLLFNKATGELITSTDYGETWEVQPINLSLGASPSVKFRSKNLGWANWKSSINNPARVMLTLDGAQTWDELILPELSVPTEEVIYVHFFDESTGYVLTNEGGNLYTTDGGESWESYYMDIERYTAASILDQQVFLVGDAYFFQKTF